MELEMEMEMPMASTDTRGNPPPRTLGYMPRTCLCRRSETPVDHASRAFGDDR